MKTFFTLLLFTISSLFASAQSLKVTKVEATTDQLYDDQARRYLGKTMTVNVYDNSVTVSVGKFNENLRQISTDYYKKVVKDSGVETIYYTLRLNKTLNVITSAIFTLWIQEKEGNRRLATATMTGKRF